MTLKRALYWISCVAGAVGLTAGLFLLDRQRNGVLLTQDALVIARQVAAQVEGFALDAREHGEKDSFGWATRLMAQGAEPRVLGVARTQGEIQSGEMFRVDWTKPALEYNKAVTPEDSVGVRVTVRLSRVGFLGTRSNLTGDFALVAVCASFFVFIFLVTGRWVGIGEAGQLRKAVLRWSAGSKAALSQLGINVREMVRQANGLAGATAKSRAALGGLREKIHAELTVLHESKAQLREAAQIATNAESVALSAVIEANRLGPEAKHLSQQVSELHALLQRMRAFGQSGADAVNRIEAQLEPWATDADVAFHAYEAAFTAARDMGGHIRKTTESVMVQARLLQELNASVEKPAPAFDAPSVEPKVAPVAKAAAPVVKAVTIPPAAPAPVAAAAIEVPKKRRARIKTAA